MSLPWRAGTGRILFLAHRIELLSQAYQAAQKWNPTLNVGLDHGGVKACIGDQIVIASVQSVGATAPTRMLEFPPDHFDLIVVDEAHRSICAQYHRALQRFDGASQYLGITATPFRHDGVDLSNLWDEIVDPQLDLMWGIENGWLCEIKSYFVRSGVDISDLETRGDDFTEESLEAHTDTDWRNSHIISGMQEYAYDRKCFLVFASSVKHAEHLCEKINEKTQWKFEVVTGKTPKGKRKEIIAKLKSGEIDGLVGCQVFIEGFDEPRIDCIVMARPTKSLVQFSQSVGRGTRPHEDKQDLLILDIVDVCRKHEIVHLSDMFGEREVDFLGRSYSEVMRILKGAQELGVNTASKTTDEIEKEVKQIEDLMGGRIVEIPTTAVQIDLFQRVTTPTPEVDAASVFRWMKMRDRDYLLPSTRQLRTRLVADAVGNWRIEWKGREGTERKALGNGQRPPFKEADRVAKGLIEKLTGKPWSMFSRNAPWRNKKATTEDIAQLRNHGINALPGDLTRGAATDLASFLSMKV